MKYFTRAEILELLPVDDAFLTLLEEEEIIWIDAPDDPARYSERMLERTRVSYNLVQDLDVNVAGIAVILSLREQVAELQQRLVELAGEVARRRG
jgi:hypothetical protein